MLSMLWLEEHNPHLDWKSRNIIFNSYKYVIIGRPANWQYSVVDKKIPFNLTSTSKDSMWNLFTATLIDIPEKDGGHKKPKGKKNTSIKNKNSLLSNIPKKYHEWLHLFRKDAVTLF